MTLTQVFIAGFFAASLLAVVALVITLAREGVYVISTALRYMRSRKVSWVAAALISAIVTMYLLVISAMEGFNAHYMDKIQSILSHASVNVGNLAWGILRPEAWAKEIKDVDPGIRGVTIGLETPVMALFASGRTAGILRGVDLPEELAYGRVKEILSPPDLKAFGTHRAGGRDIPGCILGGAWRKQFGVKLGDVVTFLFSDEHDDARTQAFAVAGFFEGQNAILEGGAYVDRQFLAKKIDVVGAKTLNLWLTDPDRSDLRDLQGRVRARMLDLIDRDGKGIVEDLQQFRSSVEVDTWQDKEAGLYQTMSRENLVMRFIMAIFLALTAFVIYLIFGRLVADKVRDIGALRAMGATPAGIRGCFLMQGFFIGAVGLGLGLLFGFGLIHTINPIFDFFGVDLLASGGMFGKEKIPMRTLPDDVLLISSLTILSAILGALAPAWRASQMNPVECLRHE